MKDAISAKLAKTNLGLTDEYIDGRFAYWSLKS